MAKLIANSYAAEQAFHWLIQRHKVLRSVFIASADHTDAASESDVIQQVRDDVQFSLVSEDCSSLSEARQHQRIQQAIIDCIHQQSIHRTNCASSAFYPLVQDHTQWHKLQSLHWLKFGGESIAIARLAPWLATQNQVTLVNMYGPTECTDISCTYTVPLPCEDAVIPIGFANDNVRLYVLDA